jgi:hypothetical protein
VSRSVRTGQLTASNGAFIGTWSQVSPVAGTAAWV